MRENARRCRPRINRACSLKYLRDPVSAVYSSACTSPMIHAGSLCPASGTSMTPQVVYSVLSFVWCINACVAYVMNGCTKFTNPASAAVADMRSVLLFSFQDLGRFLKDKKKQFVYKRKHFFSLRSTITPGPLVSAPTSGLFYVVVYRASQQNFIPVSDWLLQPRRRTPGLPPL